MHNLLQILCNRLLNSADDPIPITFRTRDGILIKDSLKGSIPQQKIDVEKVPCYKTLMGNINTCRVLKMISLILKKIFMDHF